MKTVQDMMTAEIERLITSAGLVMVKAPQWANTGTLHAMRGLEPVLAIRYEFNDSYASLSLTGTAVEQAPFEFLAAQHQLARNRVCRGGMHVVRYDVQLVPAHVTDRRGLTIQFYSLKFGTPGEVQEFLDVVRELVPGAPHAGTPAEDDTQAELDRLTGLIRQRPDAAEALDYVLAQPADGPSCGCGGRHWSCDATAEPL
jgi:hypothetical protein